MKAKGITELPGTVCRFPPSEFNHPRRRFQTELFDIQPSYQITTKLKRWLTKKHTESLVPARRNLFSEGGVMHRNRKDCHCTTIS
jgi:hypothetical protein